MKIFTIIVIFSILGILAGQSERISIKQKNTADGFVNEETPNTYNAASTLKEGHEKNITTGIIGYVIERDGDDVLIVDSENIDISIWLSNAPEDIMIGQKVNVTYDGVVFFSDPSQAEFGDYEIVSDLHSD